VTGFAELLPVFIRSFAGVLPAFAKKPVKTDEKLVLWYRCDGVRRRPEANDGIG
jgi:hypothetical protein